ncbi:hypothetical protein BGX26_008323 [Mortierella sp. AD094]|nr:hypothetical protein BGX26_008323 [Mortierella sp. AD094]
MFQVDIVLSDIVTVYTGAKRSPAKLPNNITPTVYPMILIGMMGLDGIKAKLCATAQDDYADTGQILPTEQLSEGLCPTFQTCKYPILNRMNWTYQKYEQRDAQVASQYLNNHAAFLETARFWTECYAKPEPGDTLFGASSRQSTNGNSSAPGSNNHQQQQPAPAASFQVPEPVLTKEELEKRRKVQDLVEMGFEADRARTFLIRANWNTEAALEDLLNNS